MNGKKVLISAVVVIVSITFIIVGSIMLVVGTGLISVQESFPNEVTGVIESFDEMVTEEEDIVKTTYSMTVSYEVDGQTYRSHMSEYRPSMKVGDEIKVYYSEPGDTVLSDGLGKVGTILSSVGGGLDLLAVIAIILVIVKNKKPTPKSDGMGKGIY